MDAHLPEWLWPIALFGGLGAFIDFLLGRAGQSRTRRFLESWWIHFDDVRWGNFGQKEALFAVSMFDRWCGRRLFSVRRWVFVVAFYMVFAIVGCVASILINGRFAILFTKDDIWYLLVSALGLAASVSISSKVSGFIARLAPTRILGNLFIWLLLVLASYIFLAYWTPALHAFTGVIVYLVKALLVKLRFDLVTLKVAYTGAVFFANYWVHSHMSMLDLVPGRLLNKIIDGFHSALQAKSMFYAFSDFITLSAGYAANLIRLAISIIFVASFLFQPLLQRPLSLIWLRIVESDKPIFSLVFGGVSAVAVAVSQLAKHL